MIFCETGVGVHNEYQTEIKNDPVDKIRRLVQKRLKGW